MRMESSWRIRSPSQKHSGMGSSGKTISQRRCLARATGSKSSHICNRRVSNSVFSGHMLQVWLSALASCSMSLTRWDIRFPSASMMSKNFWSLAMIPFLTAETLLNMTVRGERSSCEAEAMNCICFFLFSCKGRSIREVKHQKKIVSKSRAERSAHKKESLWSAMCFSVDLKE